MRGFLSLEPDPSTLADLHSVQNRLRAALTRQGVHFPDRLGIPLLSWPYASFDQLSEASERLHVMRLPLRLEPLSGQPNSDRPSEIGFQVQGLSELQESLFQELREPLDPDPPKAGFLRLVRISPPSRKVGAALAGSGQLGLDSPLFVPSDLTVWRQSPTGFEAYRTIRVLNGGT